jgi:aminoglycoside phosphotransferase (APT) family kinase protein
MSKYGNESDADCDSSVRGSSQLRSMTIRDLVNLELLGRILSDVMGDDRWLVCDASLIAGGKSNLTFEISCEAGTVILRRPPKGMLLPSAHDMAREARIQAALANTSVPVAAILYVEANGETIGVPFYVMEKVLGHVIRGELPDHYAESSNEKLTLTNTLVDVLLELHSVDPESVGLSDFGRANGYLERQINRWSDQWEKSKTVEVVAINQLIDKLKKHVPKYTRSSLVHGDYRLDNCVMSVESTAQMNAVLDWELSSLGDPMVDLSLALFYWRQPEDYQLTLIPSVTSTPGFPSATHLANRYSESSDLGFDELPFYEAFARFKFAVITQGVLARVATDAMAGQDFGNLEGEVREIAEDGLAKMSPKG